MSGTVEKINLFAETHAIEVANFVVNLALPIDHADIRRFDENVDKIKQLFPAINSPEVIQFAFGNVVPGQNRPPPPVPVKELTFFSSDGRPEWVGSFGENKVLISCRKYTGWEKVWPAAEERLNLLVSCLDPYKPVHSVEYSVTDTFWAAKSENALVAPKLFKNNDYIPTKLLNTNDPRWDFNQGWFADQSEPDQVLIRVEARSGIQNENVVASISNLHSQRFGSTFGVGDLTAKDENGGSRAHIVFDKFHDLNKDLLKELLAYDLLVRMHLEVPNV